jgi:hypothetical protein
VEHCVADSPQAVLDRVVAATNNHDLDALAACFSPDYRSEQPAHPGREFVGPELVREHWSIILGAVEDFRQEVLSSASVGDTIWWEARWSGSQPNNESFEVRGVGIAGVCDGLIAWARLYFEPVEAPGPETSQVLAEQLEA